MKSILPDEKFLVLQHSRTSPIGFVSNWLTDHQFSYDLVQAPLVQDWDALCKYRKIILLGGTMNIGEENSNPWLLKEYSLVQKWINDNCKIFGICLGAQILAHVLGAKVFKQEQWETGFQEVQFDPGNLLNPEKIKMFHFHQYAFELPKNAKPLGASLATKFQGFTHEKNILCFQFHPEANNEWVQFCANDTSEKLPTGTFCQTREQMLSDIPELAKSQKWLSKVLNQFFL